MLHLFSRGLDGWLLKIMHEEPKSHASNVDGKTRRADLNVRVAQELRLALLESETKRMRSR
jgi:hypothetical protein